MSYMVFMVLAIVGAGIAARFTPPSPLAPAQRLFIGLVGFCAALLAAKLPFVLLGDDLLHNAGSILLSGKTILLGLVGGYAGVEFAKWHLGITTSTGDSFAIPVAVGIGIGRLGCFFGGCCYGTATVLPWAVVFPTVDKIARHPVQLYESVFHLSMAAILYALLKRKMLTGQLIKLYYLSYFAFRFMTEFIRPEIQWTLGLSAYQWAILFLAPIFIGLWLRDAKKISSAPPSGIAAE